MPINFVRVIVLPPCSNVFGFEIEFFENQDFGIFGHFMVIDFITRYSYQTYFSPISTS